MEHYDGPRQAMKNPRQHFDDAFSACKGLVDGLRFNDEESQRFYQANNNSDRLTMRFRLCLRIVCGGSMLWGQPTNIYG